MKYSLFLLSFFILVSCGDNSKKSTQIVLRGIQNNETVKTSLPLMLKGYITNHDTVSKKAGKKLFVYIYEKDTKEKRWHIDAKVTVNKKGNFTAPTWLGNKWLGNNNTFTVCAILSKKNITIKGRYPRSKIKLQGIAEKCLTLKRKD